MSVTHMETYNSLKMKHFLFKVTKSSDIRGYNRTIRVYFLLNHKPISVGAMSVNTASYKGDEPCAHEIIANACNYKFDGYKLVRKDITVYEI